MKMHPFEYAVILLDSSAPSFCYYSVENRKKETMTEEMLDRAISFCMREECYSTVVYGNELPDDACMTLLSEFPHTRIIPLSLAVDVKSSDIYTVDFDDFESTLTKLKPTSDLNVILRMNLGDVLFLADLLEQFCNRFIRLNVIFRDIQDADEIALNKYRLDLAYMRELLFKQFTYGRYFELNFATDRMSLFEMNNCNAGVTHVTLAPNGNFYVCPGFYYDNCLPAGSLENGINIGNRQLFEYTYSPICNPCDCYQCKRCIYLNRRMTLEVNTPSHAQCVASHHERNMSGFLLEKLQNRGFMASFPKIEPLFYLDPIEILDV